MAVQWIRARSDGLIAVGMTVLVQAEIWLAGAPDPDELAPLGAALGPWAGAMAALAFTISLAWRRQRPLLVLVLAMLALATASAGTLDASLALTGALMITTYSVGAHCRSRMAIVGGMAVAGLAVVSAFRPAAGPEELSDLVLPLALLGGPWLAGLAIRERRDRVALLEERATILERGRQEQLRVAAAEERSRIARELHDIVAHAMTIIVLQARGARRAIDTDPPAAREALAAIEATGTEALAEMRRLLGVLREEPDGPGAEPGLAALEDLVVQLGQAGLLVDVQVDGAPRPIPPSLDRAAYRILQEALTNVLRHAGVDRATVRIAYRPDDLELAVTDAGRQPATHGEDRTRQGSDEPRDERDHSEGRGVVGMRERALALGGSFMAGPGPDGGYAVTARLPFAPAFP